RADAMAPYCPPQHAAYGQALQRSLGTVRQPLSGNSALLHVGTGYAGTPSDEWIVPKQTKNAAMAWRFIRIASDAVAQRQSAEIIGLAPANRVAVKTVKDPGIKYVAKLA